jgi:hypothetical protein
MKHYLVTENDITRLSKEESNDIFSKRRRNKAVEKISILQQAAIMSGIETKSNYTEDILPQMLNGADLSPFSLHEDPLINTKYVAEKTCRTINSSKSSTTSLYCSSNEKVCEKCSEYEKENKMLKNDVHTMGIVLEQVLIEMKDIKEMIKDVKNEKSTREPHTESKTSHKIHVPSSYMKENFNNNNNFRPRYNNYHAHPRRHTISLDPYQKRINKHIRF